MLFSICCEKKATAEKSADFQMDIQKWEHDMSVSEKELMSVKQWNYRVKKF